MPATSGCCRRAPPTRCGSCRERNRFFKGLASWIGFRQFRVDYEPAARAHGRTSWNLYALIGLSIEGLTSFSVAPLRLASLLGLLLAVVALLFGALDPVGDAVLRQIGPRLSVGRGRADGAGRRAAHHDRHHGRIHRQDPVRDQSAAGLFRRRAQRADRARAGRPMPVPRRRRSHRRRMSVAARAQHARPIWLCADDYGISPAVSKAIRDLVMRGPAQRHLGHGGGAELRPRRGGLAEHAQRRRAPGGDRPARHADRPFQPMSAGFRPTRARRVPVARRRCSCAARCGLLDRRRSAPRSRHSSRPLSRCSGAARFHRRPSARASVPAGARGAARRGQGAGAAAPGCASAAAPATLPRAAARPQGADARCAQRASSARSPRSSGIATNPAFAGTYDFAAQTDADFARLFPGFLGELPAAERGDVPSGLRRCRARAARSADHAARARIRLSRGRRFPRRAARRMASRWPDEAASRQWLRPACREYFAAGHSAARCAPTWRAEVQRGPGRTP